MREDNSSEIIHVVGKVTEKIKSTLPCHKWDTLYDITVSSKYNYPKWTHLSWDTFDKNIIGLKSLSFNHIYMHAGNNFVSG